MPIFEDFEMDSEYVFGRETLPTNNDVLKYVLSRKGDHHRNVRLREMSKIIFDLWEKADCCPQNVLRITQIYEQLDKNYVKHLKKNGSKNHRKRPSTSPPPQPTRKSGRQSSPLTPITPNVLNTPLSTCTPPSSQNTPKSTRSNPDNHFNARKLWDSEYGEKLFDVLNRDRILEVVKSGGATSFMRTNVDHVLLLCKLERLLTSTRPTKFNDYKRKLENMQEK